MKNLAISFLTAILLVSQGSFALAQVRMLTVEGEIACLPHRDRSNGMTTLECAYGLKGRDGNYYGLGSLHQDDLISGKISTGQIVRVTGMFELDHSSLYDIIGTIQVQSIVPLGVREGNPPLDEPGGEGNFSPPGEGETNGREGYLQWKQEQMKMFKQMVEMRRYAMQSQIDVRLQESREAIKTTWENRRTGLDEQRKERIKQHVRNMVQHVIDRLVQY